MNEDFGVGRRRRVTQFDVASRPSPGYVSRYNYEAGGADALAVTVDGPVWTGILPEPVNPDSSSPADQSNGSGNNSNKPPKQRWYKRISRKQWLVGGAVLLLLAGSGTAYALLGGDKAAKPTVSKAKPAPKPPTPPPPPVSPLTGLPVAAADVTRPVIGVMIENSTFARPQSGLDQAGVVYEAIAEYGITRFLALYQEANPANIGPVRSARPYYVDWARAYDASYAHVGGSPDALAKIRSEGIRDMDQFANSGAYRRISSRFAPHNVYTTMDQLRGLSAGKGWTTSKFTPLARKKEAPAKTPTARSIAIGISGPTYNVNYDYDPATNTYHRTMGGQPHSDADSGKRITPKVVIGLATQYGLMPDGYHSSYSTTGSAAVKIFQDGTVTEGTWKREGVGGQYIFLDAAGKQIAINPGQVWFTVVGDPGAITYVP